MGHLALCVQVMSSLIVDTLTHCLSIFAWYSRTSLDDCSTTTTSPSLQTWQGVVPRSFNPGLPPCHNSHPSCSQMQAGGGSSLALFGMAAMSAGGRRGQGGSKGGQGRVTRREDEGNKYVAGAQTMLFGPLVHFVFVFFYALTICFHSLGCKLLALANNTHCCKPLLVGWFLFCVTGSRGCHCHFLAHLAC
jgi:hypothetical protein